MNRRSFLVHAAGLAGLCAVTRAARADGPAWGYDGANGPARWGELSPDFAACAQGREQSPVDLTRPAPAMLPDPLVEWRPVPPRVSHTGRAIQVDAPGGGTMTLDGVRHDLRHYVFHHPGEHRVDGAGFAMEIQVVHQAESGALAILALPVVVGAANPGIETIWRLLPDRPGETMVGPAPFDPATLLPDDRVSYRYAGSLTVPPCSEQVEWVVLRRPVAASGAQVARLARLLPPNARPVQPLNRRKLLLDVL